MTTSLSSVARPARPGLAELVERIRRCTRQSTDPLEAARLVAGALQEGRPTTRLLTEQERAGSATDYLRVTLHTEAMFSISAVIWRPGQFTEIHDHLVWCSFIILQGVETETIFDFAGDHLVEIGQRQRPVGSVSAVAPPDDIHQVHNTGDEVAITLHVYGADLTRGTSVRRTYHRSEDVS
jgi:predicted metal-dependent enzyme (double-stranded beta helix superfamily)